MWISVCVADLKMSSPDPITPFPEPDPQVRSDPPVPLTDSDAMTEVVQNVTIFGVIAGTIGTILSGGCFDLLDFIQGL